VQATPGFNSDRWAHTYGKAAAFRIISNPSESQPQKRLLTAESEEGEVRAFSMAFPELNGVQYQIKQFNHISCMLSIVPTDVS